MRLGLLTPETPALLTAEAALDEVLAMLFTFLFCGHFFTSLFGVGFGFSLTLLVVTKHFTVYIWHLIFPLLWVLVVG